MFELSKWYLDCVTDAGAAAILYRASVKWGLLRLDYGASLHLDERTAPAYRYTLRPGDEVTVGEHAVNWTSPKLKVAGTWPAPPHGIRRTLHDGPDGTIRWQCINPGGSAEVSVNGFSLSGTGYVEHLTVTVKP